MLRFCIFAALLSALQTGIEASPAKLERRAPPAACTDTTWGWPGFVRGTNPWGAVLNPSQSSVLSSELSTVCAPYTPSSTITFTSTTSTTVISGSSSRSIISSPPPAASSSSGSSSASSSSISAGVTTLSPSSSRSTTSSSTSTSSIVNPATSSPASRASSSSSQAPAPIASSSSSSSSSSSAAASTGTSGSPSSSDINSYLSAHNTVRAQHGATALTWNNTLSAAAQKWANGCQFKHSGGSLGPFGENLAAGTGNYQIANAVNSWTSEVSQYDPNNPVPSHFTQVVWKASTQLGCAVATCNGIFDPKYGPAQYYVCEYYPQGNVIGRFPQNVQV